MQRPFRSSQSYDPKLLSFNGYRRTGGCSSVEPGAIGKTAFIARAAAPNERCSAQEKGSASRKKHAGPWGAPPTTVTIAHSISIPRGSTTPMIAAINGGAVRGGLSWPYSVTSGSSRPQRSSASPGRQPWLPVQHRWEITSAPASASSVITSSPGSWHLRSPSSPA